MTWYKTLSVPRSIIQHWHIQHVLYAQDLSPPRDSHLHPLASFYHVGTVS